MSRPSPLPAPAGFSGGIPPERLSALEWWSADDLAKKAVQLAEAKAAKNAKLANQIEAQIERFKTGEGLTALDISRIERLYATAMSGLAR